MPFNPGLLAAAQAQTLPTREYVRLGDRVIAIENQGFIATCSTCSLTDGGGTGQINIVASTGVTWNATVTSGSSWLTVQNATGNPVGFTAAANTTSSSVYGTISITTNTSVTQTVTVTVAGTQQSTITINPTSAAVSASGYSSTVTVTAGTGVAWAAQKTAWTGTGSDTLTLSGASGSGSGSFSYTVGVNTTTTAQSGTVTICNGSSCTGSNAVATFSISQAAAALPTLTVSPYAASVAPGEGIQYLAYINGVQDTRSTLSWTAKNGSTSYDITSAGFFIAPNVSSPTTITITATDPTVANAGTATVTVAEVTITSVTLTPNSGTNAAGSWQLFQALITLGTGNQTLPSLLDGGGTNFAFTTTQLTAGAPVPTNGCDVFTNASLLYVQPQGTSDDGDEGPGFYVSPSGSSWVPTVAPPLGYYNDTNTYCSLDMLNSNYTSNSNTAPSWYSLNYYLMYFPVFGGSQNMWFELEGAGGYTMAWTQLGTWTVPSYQPPSVTLQSPANNATVSGTTTVAGWALDNILEPETAISSFDIYVDSTLVSSTSYGNVARTDICTAATGGTGQYPGRPGCPNVGFSFNWNTLFAANGTHTVQIVATDSDPGMPHHTTVSASVTVNNANPIPVNLQLSDLSISSGTTVYQASNSITAGNNVTINGSASITFQAGNSIVLQQGFTAVAGSSGTTFVAQIVP